MKKKPSQIEQILQQLPKALKYGNFNQKYIDIVEQDLKDEDNVILSYCDNVFSISSYLVAVVGLDKKVVDQLVLDAVQLHINKLENAFTNPLSTSIVS